MAGQTPRSPSVPEFLQARLGLAQTPDDSLDLRDDLGMDSLDAVELVMDLELEYHLEISDDELEKLRSVGDVRRLVDALSREQA